MEGENQNPETKPYQIKINLENGLKFDYPANATEVATFLEFFKEASNDTQILDIPHPNGDLLLLSAWHLKRAVINIENVKQD